MKSIKNVSMIPVESICNLFNDEQQPKEICRGLGLYSTVLLLGSHPCGFGEVLLHCFFFLLEGLKRKRLRDFASVLQYLGPSSLSPVS
jgi:hypothetical protein